MIVKKNNLAAIISAAIMQSQRTHKLLKTWRKWFDVIGELLREPTSRILFVSEKNRFLAESVLPIHFKIHCDCKHFAKARSHCIVANHSLPLLKKRNQLKNNSVFAQLIVRTWILFPRKLNWISKEMNAPHGALCSIFKWAMKLCVGFILFQNNKRTSSRVQRNYWWNKISDSVHQQLVWRPPSGGDLRFASTASKQTETKSAILLPSRISSRLCVLS